jgi:hypothetical protein
LDTGTARFEWNGEIVLDLPSGAFAGTGPDLGAHEANSLEAHSALFEILREQIAAPLISPRINQRA